jgi:hypothetical protein
VLGELGPLEDAPALHLVIPVRTVSEANSHEHWRARQRRAKEQRGIALLVARGLGKPPAAPLTITLTRVSPRALDSDNLAGSQKHVRDGIADWLGVDDGDPRLTWLYEQRRGAAGATEITITARS